MKQQLENKVERTDFLPRLSAPVGVHAGDKDDGANAGKRERRELPRGVDAQDKAAHEHEQTRRDLYTCVLEGRYVQLTQKRRKKNPPNFPKIRFYLAQAARNAGWITIAPFVFVWFRFSSQTRGRFQHFLIFLIVFFPKKSRDFFISLLTTEMKTKQNNMYTWRGV
jgi:hypothetical protein